MNTFIQIDDKLEKMAKQLGTEVAVSVGQYSFDGIDVPKDKLETRRIVWIEDSIGKAIMIVQNFEDKNIDAPDWDLTIVAWLHTGITTSRGRPFWQRRLLKKVKFKEIERNIDELLQRSVDSLKSVATTDLGYSQ